MVNNNYKSKKNYYFITINLFFFTELIIKKYKMQILQTEKFILYLYVYNNKYLFYLFL